MPEPRAMSATPAPGGPAPGGVAHHHRTLMVGLAVLAMVATGSITGVYLVAAHLNSNLRHLGRVLPDPAGSGRPAPVAGTQTILAVGHPDERGVTAATGGAGQRADTITVIQVRPGGLSARMVAIPGYTAVPGAEHGAADIRDAYRRGGPGLLVHTVEGLLRIEIDHFMIVGFSGLRSVVDLLGGVDVRVAPHGSDLNGVALEQSLAHLDGAGALRYAQQDDSPLPHDLGGQVDGANSASPARVWWWSAPFRLDPQRIYQRLDTATRSMTVDGSFTSSDLRSLVASGLRAQLRQVRSGGDRDRP